MLYMQNSHLFKDRATQSLFYTEQAAISYKTKFQSTYLATLSRGTRSTGSVIKNNAKFWTTKKSCICYFSYLNEGIFKLSKHLITQVDRTDYTLFAGYTDTGYTILVDNLFPISMLIFYIA